MSRNFRMLLQYDGTDFDGWQKQGNTDNTIQGKLEQVLGRLEGRPVEVHGAGRTDAGVHAEEQTANVRLRTELDAGQLKDYLNRYLPESILVLDVREADERFHSRLNAVGKIYTYCLDMADKCSVFQRKYTYTLGRLLDIDAMRQAAAYLCGTHDFRSFCANKHMKKSTVRTIDSIDIRVRGTRMEIRIQGDGFLYNMVRILVGTLIEAGQGKRTPESIPDVIRARSRQAAGFTAPARGLFLTKVLYGNEAGQAADKV